MAKFCKLFEDDKGEQLLVLLTQSKDNEERADVNLHFELDGASANVGILGGKWEACEQYLENFSKETALEILKDPYGWIQALVS